MDTANSISFDEVADNQDFRLSDSELYGIVAALHLASLEAPLLLMPSKGAAKGTPDPLIDLFVELAGFHVVYDAADGTKIEAVSQRAGDEPTGSTPVRLSAREATRVSAALSAFLAEGVKPTDRGILHDLGTGMGRTTPLSPAAAAGLIERLAKAF